MKIYKFRSLGSDKDFKFACEILSDSKFWHSKFSDLNDPVEGSFTIFPNKNNLGTQVIENIYGQKDLTYICSFSGKKGFKEPTLWGHYANGFKGIAIEIEVDAKTVVKMRYSEKITHLENKGNIEKDTKKILSNKLSPWKLEDEYRSLVMGKGGYQNVGKIIAIYFGNPYSGAVNKKNIYNGNKALQKFDKLKGDLIKKATEEKVKSYSVKIEGCKVVKNNLLK